MSAAIDTNVLVRVLVQDPTAAAKCAAAKRGVADASASGEPLLVTPRTVCSWHAQRTSAATAS